MSIEAVCPACMTVNEIDDDEAGTKVRCEECSANFTAPTAKQAKAAKAKATEAPPVDTAGRRQVLMSIVMAFLSLIAIAAVAGLGIYQILTTDAPRVVKPK